MKRWLVRLLLLSSILASGWAGIACRSFVAIDTERVFNKPASQNVTFVGQIGGPLLAIAVQGRYAYAGFGFAFMVLDLREPNQPQPVGHLSLSANIIVVADHTAYVGGRDGLAVVDITVPTQPALISFFATRGVVMGVAIIEQVAYVVDADGHLYIVSLKAPTAPQQVSMLRLMARLEGITVVNHTVYLMAYRGFYIIDITDRIQPRQVNFMPMPGLTQRMAINNHHAYITADGGLAVLDIRDPFRPNSVAYLPLATYAKDVVIVGNDAYVSTGPNGVYQVDITTPGAPVLVDHLTLPGHSHDLAAQGIYLYSANLDGQLAILASQAGKWRTIGSYDTPGPVWKLQAVEQMIYAIAGFADDIHIIDATTSTTLHERGFYRTPGSTVDIAVRERYLNAVDSAGKLSILAITDASRPHLVSTLAIAKTASRITMIGGFAYVMTPNGPPVTVNIAQVEKPTVVSACAMTDVVYDMALAGEAFYLAAGPTGLQVVAASQSCPVDQFLLTDGLSTAEQVVVAGNYAYLAVPTAGLAVVDIAEPLLPKLVSLTKIGPAITDITVVGNEAFVTAGEAGLYILDLTDPTDLAIIGFYDTPDFARSVDVSNGRIYVADELGGLLVLR